MRKFLLLAMAFAMTAIGLHAQMMPQLPVIANDTLTRVGKLDNGLTYYIRHNEKPEHVADFYIAQRVGSLQEDDSQRGLAHFLEHMAFNGSEHFKAGDVVEFGRRLGVAFGRDLNAYTSLDKTVYNICNVPTARLSALDSCLLVLCDWSCGLQLLPDEIDKERGVVHGEWAMRSSAMQRLNEKALPLLFPGCKYGERLPIGLMEVVDSFQPQTLRAYYEKWYHPAHQAIIVIGDVDVNRTEQKIREMFGDIRPHSGAAYTEEVTVPDNEQPIMVCDHDKEMPYTVMELMMKSDPLPRQLRATQLSFVQQFVSAMMRSMFNMRMTELAQEPDAPFLQIQMNYGRYCGIAATKDALSVSAVPKEGKEKETLTAMVKELRRLNLYGFTQGEYLRAKEEFLSNKEKAYSNRDKRKNSEHYQRCLSNYLEGYAMPDAETNWQNWQLIAQSIGVDAINQSLKQLVSIDTDKNLVGVCFAQEKDGAVYLTADDMNAVIAQARLENVEAWVDNAKDEPLIKDMPKAGKIVKEKENKTFGYTELTLQNGARVCLKKTDFKDDEVLLRGWAPGGSWLYGEPDFATLKLYNQIVETFGLGGFTNTELQKALAGKQCGLSISLDERYDNVNGHSVPKDVETMLQLLYLYFTAPQLDEKSYTSFMNTVATALKNRDLQPETALSDSLSYYADCANPRFQPLLPQQINQVSATRSLEITRERFAGVGDYVFTIIGNYDEQAIRQLVCQYIGALPGKSKTKTNTRDERTYFSGNVVCDFKKQMETPKPYVVEIYKGDVEHTLKNRVLATFAGEVLQMMLMKEVREDAGAAYSVGASSYISVEPEKSFSMLRVVAPISAPEKVDTALVLIEKCIDELSVKADADMVEKVRKNLLKQADINARQNGTWQGIIESWYVHNMDVSTDYKKIVAEVSADEVSDFLKKRILEYHNKLKLVMRPE